MATTAPLLRQQLQSATSRKTSIHFQSHYLSQLLYLCFSFFCDAYVIHTLLLNTFSFGLIPSVMHTHAHTHTHSPTLPLLHCPLPQILLSILCRLSILFCFSFSIFPKSELPPLFSSASPLLSISILTLPPSIFTPSFLFLPPRCFSLTSEPKKGFTLTFLISSHTEF